MTTETLEPPVAEDVEGSEEAVEGSKGKRGRVKAEDDPRVEYIVPEAMADDKGLIKAWLDGNGYVFGAEKKCHKPLSKKAFTSPEIWVDYKIASKLNDRKLIDDQIALMRKNRDAFNHIENADTRVKLKKLAQLRKNIALLHAQCEADGITAEDVDKMLEETND